MNRHLMLSFHTSFLSFKTSYQFLWIIHTFLGEMLGEGFPDSCVFSLNANQHLVSL